MYKQYKEYVIGALDSREMLEQLAEESAELSQAALKVIRAYGLSANPARCSPQEAMEALVEEVGDVMMMIDALGLDDVDTVDNPKWERWAIMLGAERAEDEKGNETC